MRVVCVQVFTEKLAERLTQFDTKLPDAPGLAAVLDKLNSVVEAATQKEQDRLQQAAANARVEAAKAAPAKQTVESAPAEDAPQGPRRPAERKMDDTEGQGASPALGGILASAFTAASGAAAGLVHGGVKATADVLTRGMEKLAPDLAAHRIAKALDVFEQNSRLLADHKNDGDWILRNAEKVYQNLSKASGVLSELADHKSLDEVAAARLTNVKKSLADTAKTTDNEELKQSLANFAKVFTEMLKKVLGKLGMGPKKSSSPAPT